MGEEVERLQSQVGALRREVWFSRRREWGGAAAGAALEVLAGNPGTSSSGATLGAAELVSVKRLSGTFPPYNVRVLILDSTTKQNVKL
jgi:hypothetical protein